MISVFNSKALYWHIFEVLEVEGFYKELVLDRVNNGIVAVFPIAVELAEQN
jgi:hypothetical protein